MPIEHEAKTHREPFKALWLGIKLYELRVDDRDPRYEVGDRIWLREWMPQSGYTGRWVKAEISYITRGGIYGLPPHMCILGLDKESMTASDEHVAEGYSRVGDFSFFKRLHGHEKA